MHKRLTPEQRLSILEDVKKAVKYAEEAGQHTLRSIAKRNHVHPRTIQKLLRVEKSPDVPKCMPRTGDRLRVLGVWV